MDDFLRQALQLMVEYVSARSAAVVVRDRHGNSATGSSTCIRVGDHLLLATAAHVIEDLDDSRITLIPRGRWSGRGPLRFSSRSCHPGRSAPSSDVAWIEIDPGSAALASGLRFLELSDLLRGQRSDRDRPFMVHGYPVESAVVAEETADVEATAAMTMMAETHELPRTLGGHELALEWPPRDASNQPMQDVPSPKGVSGGGTWRQPRHDEQIIMSPSHFRLVGVNVRWHRASSILFAVRIEHWLDLVAEDFPDTRELIASVRAAE